MIEDIELNTVDTNLVAMPVCELNTVLNALYDQKFIKKTGDLDLTIKALEEEIKSSTLLSDIDDLLNDVETN